MCHSSICRIPPSIAFDICRMVTISNIYFRNSSYIPTLCVKDYKDITAQKQQMHASYSNTETTGAC